MDIDEIKKRLDIVQIIGEYLTLKKSGVTYKALCPFHTEKTPSFTVSAERASWHCFGCNEGGDVISFVQKIEGLTFVEAMERLAARAGVEFRAATPKEIQARSDKSTVLEVLEMATRLYHELLLHHPSAEVARQYLAKRGVSNEMIKQFRLGFAPDAWHTIEAMMQKKKMEPKWAALAGLLVQKPSDRRYYDRFRQRLIFPIDNPAGQIIGFTGRILIDDQNQPKYLNTSESPVFHKSEVLYAISLARAEIRKHDQAVLVEGQMDVIAAHQFNFNYTVATSGTALTNDHLAVIKRYTENILFALDADAAGLKALKTASVLAYQAGLNPKVVTIPSGKDPDEAIRHDRSAWQAALDQATSAFEFFLTHLSQSNLTKKMIVRDLAPLIHAVKSEVEQATFYELVAGRLGVSIASVKHDVQAEQAPPSTHPSKDATLPALPELDLERQIIGLIFAYPEVVGELPARQFQNEALGEIYRQLQTSRPSKIAVDQIMAKLPKSWQDRLSVLILETLRRHEELDENAIAQEISDSLQRLVERERDGRVLKNAQAIAKAFREGDRETARQLLKSLEHDMIEGNDTPPTSGVV